MKLARLTRAGRRRADIDDALAAYSGWRSECAAVRAAYGTWARAARSDASVAFGAYKLALEREERAADVYAQLLRRAQRRPEIGVATQLAHLPALSGY